MTARTLALVCASTLAFSGCGREADEKAAPGPVASAPAPREFSGTYRVKGKTVEKGGTRGARPLAGTIILVQQGDAYTSTFELETELPTPEGAPAHAQVIGKGDGVVTNDGLKGTAQTQIVWSDVPGVNSQFAFIPKRYGPRIASLSTARLQPDGTIVIEIDSEPIAGSAYIPTHTTLRGARVPADRPGS